eukprot:1157210-Pelagomonas_calceolata.AAC.3
MAWTARPRSGWGTTGRPCQEGLVCSVATGSFQARASSGWRVRFRVLLAMSPKKTPKNALPAGREGPSRRQSQHCRHLHGRRGSALVACRASPLTPLPAALLATTSHGNYTAATWHAEIILPEYGNLPT